MEARSLALVDTSAAVIVEGHAVAGRASRMGMCGPLSSTRCGDVGGENPFLSRFYFATTLVCYLSIIIVADESRGCSLGFCRLDDDLRERDGGVEERRWGIRSDFVPVQFQGWWRFIVN